MLIDFNEWMGKHSQEIATVQAMLNDQISEDLNIAKEQMLRVEVWFSRLGKLLADVNKILADTKEEIKTKDKISEVKRIRDIVACQLEHIDKRISVCQSLMKVYVSEHHYGGRT